MIECPTVTKDVIRGHYDLTTVFYRLMWGRHIHHGLWEANESPKVAQLQLTQTLARLAAIVPEEDVLDVGCGMGGSSIHLAQSLDCQVTGVTISPFQRLWAATSARWQGVGNRTQFRCVDAEQMEFAPETFDVVWSIECTEHLFDKQGFFDRAAQWLRPGGRIAICAWLAGERADSQSARQQLLDVCEGFFCPSLGAAEDYQQWMRGAGFNISGWRDLTSQVVRTWEICERRVRRTGVRQLARLIDRDTVMFLDRFNVIRHAYETGAMQYGCFVAEKPL